MDKIFIPVVASSCHQVGKILEQCFCSVIHWKDLINNGLTFKIEHFERSLGYFYKTFGSFGRVAHVVGDSIVQGPGVIEHVLLKEAVLLQLLKPQPKLFYAAGLGAGYKKIVFHAQHGPKLKILPLCDECSPRRRCRS